MTFLEKIIADGVENFTAQHDAALLELNNRKFELEQAVVQAQTNKARAKFASDARIAQAKIQSETYPDFSKVDPVNAVNALVNNIGYYDQVQENEANDAARYDRAIAKAKASLASFMKAYNRLTGPVEASTEA